MKIIPVFRFFITFAKVYLFNIKKKAESTAKIAFSNASCAEQAVSSKAEAVRQQQ